MTIEPAPKSAARVTHTCSIDDQGDSLTISIVPHGSRLLPKILLGLMVYLLPWIGLSFLLNRLGSDLTSTVFFGGIALLGIAIGVVYVYIAWAYCTGRSIPEAIRITPESIAIFPGRALTQTGPDWRKARQYAAERVRGLRASPAGARGSLALDYGDATIRFAAGISPEDASRAVAEVQRRFPALLGASSRTAGSVSAYGGPDGGGQTQVSLSRMGALNAWHWPAALLGGLISVYIQFVEPAPAGYHPIWVLVLLELGLIGSLCLLIVKTFPWDRAEPSGASNRGEQRFATIAFWACVVAILAIVGYLAYGYFFIMPQQLRGTWRRFTTADGLRSNEVHGATADAQGNVWFATSAGVSVLTPAGTWVHYRANGGLGADYASDVVVDRQGRIWVATLGGGVRRFDGTGWQGFTTANSGLPGDAAQRLAVDGQDNVWVASSSGLAVIDGDDTVTFVGGPGGYHQQALAIDTNGVVWVANGSSTLAAYDPGDGQWHTTENIRTRVAQPFPHGSASIDDVAAEPQANRLWLAAGAIVTLSGGTWEMQQYNYEASAVFVAPDGSKWFGAVSYGNTHGLLVLSADGNRSWRYYGADLDRISRITGDAAGHLWFITPGDGVIELTPGQ